MGVDEHIVGDLRHRSCRRLSLMASITDDAVG
jgi:hypothetical protein